MGIKILANNHLGLWIGELRPLPWIDLFQLLPGSELKTSNLEFIFFYRKSGVKWQQVLLLKWYPTKGAATHKYHGMSATLQVVQCQPVRLYVMTQDMTTEQGLGGRNPLKKHRGNFLAQQMLHTLQRPRINQDEQNWTYILAFWYITTDSRTMCMCSVVSDSLPSHGL